MSEIMRRFAGALVPYQRQPLDLLGLPREVQRAVDLESAKGLVEATRVQAQGHVAWTRIQVTEQVASTGMAQLAALSAEEGRLIRQAPLGEERYRAIVDTFAGVVANEVAKLGYSR